jgi:hypothetical protein
MDPDILKNINKDELVKYVSDLNSLPEVIFHSEKELKKMRQEEQAQQQEMMEVQKQREQATAANQAAGAVQKIGG